MSTIFISHSSKDQAATVELAAWLRERGYDSFFLDFDVEAGIAAGTAWEDTIYRHLRLCRVLIALVSPAWIESRWCFAEVTQARSAGKRIIFVKTVPCDTSRLFPDVQHLDWFGAANEGSARLARALADVALDPASMHVWDSSRPLYPGLLSFEESDAAIFFGRDADIQRASELATRQRLTGACPFVLCLGASGSGKSSLVKAGLLPRLRKEAGAWLVLPPFRPHRNPIEELSITIAAALREAGAPRPWQELLVELLQAGDADPSRATEGLAGLVRDLRVATNHPNATVIITIDQAEELFGFSEPRHVSALLSCIRRALEPHADRLMVMATMRSDTLASFQTHSGLQGMPFEAFTVAAILRRDLPQIIEGPAALAGLTLGPGLVQTLVQDADTGDALPLLAFTLRELYERRGKNDRIGIEDYEAIGRLEGSVRMAADALIESSSATSDEHEALRAAFVPGLVMATEDGAFVRLRSKWSDLPASAHRLLALFVERRLLVSTNEGGERVLEVAHEALLRVWPRLTEWLRADSDSLRALSELRRSAELWSRHARADAWAVHSGDRLAAAERILVTPRFASQPATVLEYLDACVSRRQKEQALAQLQATADEARRKAEITMARRTRLAAYAISAIALVAAIAAVFGWQQAGLAQTQRNHALSLVSREETDKGFATLGVLLALRAYPQSASQQALPEAQAALVHGLLHETERAIFVGGTAPINALEIAPDGRTAATAAGDGELKLWDIAGHRLAGNFTGHQDAIYSVAYSPDGSRLVSASADHTARIWDVASRRALAVLSGHTDSVNFALFSPDGSRVVTASSDHTAKVWDTRSGALQSTLAGHEGELNRAQFSPDGAQIVTVSADHSARIWNSKSGQLTATPLSHGDQVVDVDFSPDGKRLVTASWDGTAHFWNAADGAALGTLAGHQEGINRAVFSPDGKLVATASADGTARLWDVATARPVAVLSGHQGQVYDAKFSPDGHWLLTAGDDGTARVWNVENHMSAEVFRAHTSRLFVARFSPDGQRIATASADGTARLWGLPEAQVRELIGHSARVHRTIVLPGDRLLSVSDDQSARVWNASTGKLLAVLQGQAGQLWFAAVDRNGRSLATTATDGSVVIWDANSYARLHTLQGHQRTVYHAHFSPDGARLVTAGDEGTAVVWDVATGEPVFRLQGHGGAVYYAEFSHDGKLIATASADMTARLWEATGKPLATLIGHKGEVVHGAFAPDDKRLVTGSWDRSARIWDTSNGKSLLTLSGHSDAVLLTRFSPDSGTIVTTSQDNSARLWDSGSGQLRQVLSGHAGEVHDADFSADGRLVVTASNDGTARLWHVASGVEVLTLSGHTGSVVSALFGPDGHTVITASHDRSSRVWPLAVGSGDDWAERARASLPRQLSAEERKAYLRGE